MVAVPEWLWVGLAIAGGLAVLFTALFAAGERFFPAPAVEAGRPNSGEWKRRAEIRQYLDAIDERFVEDHPIDGESVAFYLPERGVAITFDGQRYFEIERAGAYAVLVEHEMPGVHLGSRLPFETPETRFDRERRERERSERDRWGERSERRAREFVGERRRTGAEHARGTAHTGGTNRSGTAGPSERERLESAFETLGVSRDADVSEIRAAYRERVKEVHPDHGGEKEEFQRLQEAYTAAREAAN